MKNKILKLILLMLCCLITKLSTAQWAWSQTAWSNDKCFKGLSVSLEWKPYSNKEIADDPKHKNGFWVILKIKNNYNKKFHASLSVNIEGEEKNYGQNGIQGLFTVEAGKMYTWTSIPIATDKARTRITFNYTSELCFAESWGGCSETLKGFPRKAECDNGVPNYKINEGGNSNNNGNINNSTNSSSSDFNSSNLQDALNKLNEYCSRKYYSGDTKTTNLMNTYCNKTYQQTQADLDKINKGIKELEASLMEYDEKMGNNKKADEEKKKAADDKIAAEQKALEAKQEQFEKYMTDGDNYLSSENYDAAISSYSNAASNATNNSESTRAQTALAAAQKAKADAARKVRVAEKQAVEQKQNEATTAAVAGFAGAMALVKDQYSSRAFAAKLQIGLGYASVPLIVNATNSKKSSIKTSSPILFHLGFRLGFANKKGISFEATPFYGIGLNSFVPGIDGGSSEYGGMGTLFIGKKAKSIVKLFAEGGYVKKVGTYNYDQDVASGGTSATDNVENGEFNYSILKYGGGIMFRIINDDNLESYIKPGIFYEKPSFAISGQKPVMTFNVQLYILSNALIDFSYSKNYLIPGKLNYPYNFTTENKNYWSIKIIRQGKLH